MHNTIKKVWNHPLTITIVGGILLTWFGWHFEWCKPKVPPEIAATIHVGAYTHQKAQANKIVSYLKHDTSTKKHIPKDVIWISDPLAIDTIY